MEFCGIKEAFEDKSRVYFHKLIPGALNKERKLIKSDSFGGNLHSQGNITPNSDSERQMEICRNSFKLQHRPRFKNGHTHTQLLVISRPLMI